MRLEFVVPGAMLLTLIGCGRSSDEIRHPPLRSAPPASSLDSEEACVAQGKVQIFSQGRALCVPIPKAMDYAEFSAGSYQKLSGEERCQSLLKLVEKFIVTELVNVKVSNQKCETVASGNSERLVEFTIRWSESGTTDIGFSVEENPEKIAIWNCPKRSDNSRLCLEKVEEKSVPSSIRAIYPYPSRSILNLFPTIRLYTGAN